MQLSLKVLTVLPFYGGVKEGDLNKDDQKENCRTYNLSECVWGGGDYRAASKKYQH